MPIVIAIHICGHQFVGKTVLSNCDNSAVVSVLTSRTGKDKDMMPLLCCLLFLEAYFQFHIISCSPSHPMTAQMICHVIVCARSVLKLLKLTLISLLSPPFYSSGCSAQSRLDLSQLDSAVQYFCDKGQVTPPVKPINQPKKCLLHFVRSTQSYHRFQCPNPSSAISCLTLLVKIFTLK